MLFILPSLHPLQARAQAARRIIDSRPLLIEALSRDIISHAALAEKLKKDIELELGKKVNLPAIVMAIRRYSEEMEPLIKRKISFRFNSEIIMKTGLVDITLVKTPSALSNLKEIYSLMDYEKGQTLNVIQGNYEITIVINNKFRDRVLKIFKDEKILNIEEDLVSLTMSFSKEFLYTPGILARVTRELAWENINVYENISTMTELIFIITKKDAVRGYKVLQKIVDSE